MDPAETIAAVATPPGEGAIGIVRLSGPGAVSIVARLFRGARPLADVPSHMMVHGRIVDADEQLVDDVLVAVMRAPRSYTGEDIVEIHCHGGVVVVRRILQEVLAAGARLAEPGEFTKRAFLNGRLDLAQAEAVIDIVRARSPKGLAVAARQLEGRLSSRVDGVRRRLLDLLAHLQVAIDYPEEGIAELAPEEALEQISEAQDEIDALLKTADAGRVYREGVRIAIVGRPNVGKSSLLNALLGEARAIVTAVEGTTRDAIEEQAVLGGFPFTVTDTAGLRATDDPVERIGVERAREVMAGSDVVLAVFDMSRPLSDDDLRVLEAVREEAGAARTIAVLNKADLPGAIDGAEPLFTGLPLVQVSAKTGKGLDGLEALIVREAFGGEPPETDAILVTRERHRRLLAEAREALDSSRQAIGEGAFWDLVAVDLQSALERLAEITGDNVTEDVVDRIFAQFCVGK